MARGYSVNVYVDYGAGLAYEYSGLFIDREQAMQAAAILLDRGTCARVEAVRVIGPRGRIWFDGSVAAGDGAVLHTVCVKTGEREATGYPDEAAAADAWHAMHAWPAKWCEIHPIKADPDAQ